MTTSLSALPGGRTLWGDWKSEDSLIWYDGPLLFGMPGYETRPGKAAAGILLMSAISDDEYLGALVSQGSYRNVELGRTTPNAAMLSGDGWFLARTHDHSGAIRTAMTEIDPLTLSQEDHLAGNVCVDTRKTPHTAEGLFINREGLGHVDAVYRYLEASRSIWPVNGPIHVQTSIDWAAKGRSLFVTGFGVAIWIEPGDWSKEAPEDQRSRLALLQEMTARTRFVLCREGPWYATRRFLESVDQDLVSGELWPHGRSSSGTTSRQIDQAPKSRMAEAIRQWGEAMRPIGNARVTGATKRSSTTPIGTFWSGVRLERPVSVPLKAGAEVLARQMGGSARWSPQDWHSKQESALVARGNER